MIHIPLLFRYNNYILFFLEIWVDVSTTNGDTKYDDDNADSDCIGDSDTVDE